MAKQTFEFDTEQQPAELTFAQLKASIEAYALANSLNSLKVHSTKTKHGKKMLEGFATWGKGDLSQENLEGLSLIISSQPGLVGYSPPIPEPLILDVANDLEAAEGTFPAVTGVTAATGTLELLMPGGVAPAGWDGKTVTLDNGVDDPTVFEFDSDGSVVETDYLRAINFTAGDSLATVIAAAQAAFFNAPYLNMSVVNNGTTADAIRVKYINNYLGTVGNVPIQTTFLGSEATVTGMEGGANAEGAIIEIGTVNDLFQTFEMAQLTPEGLSILNATNAAGYPHTFVELYSRQAAAPGQDGTPEWTVDPGSLTINGSLVLQNQNPIVMPATTFYSKEQRIYYVDDDLKLYLAYAFGLVAPNQPGVNTVPWRSFDEAVSFGAV